MCQGLCGWSSGISLPPLLQVPRSSGYLQWSPERGPMLFPRSTALVWSPRQRIPHYPPESENPLSSSPNVPITPSRMGHLRRLEFSVFLTKKKSCQLYLPCIWQKAYQSYHPQPCGSPRLQNRIEGCYLSLGVQNKVPFKCFLDSMLLVWVQINCKTNKSVLSKI